jgi:hypothetical protein
VRCVKLTLLLAADHLALDATRLSLSSLNASDNCRASKDAGKSSAPAGVRLLTDRCVKCCSWPTAAARGTGNTSKLASCFQVRVCLNVRAWRLCMLARAEQTLAGTSSGCMWNSRCCMPADCSRYRSFSVGSLPALKRLRHSGRGPAACTP